MEIRQRLELKKLLAPELQHSLKILALPVLELRDLIDQELVENPLLDDNDETAAAETDQPGVDNADNIQQSDDDFDTIMSAVFPDYDDARSMYSDPAISEDDESKRDFVQSLVTRKLSLQDTLLKQLGVHAVTDNDLIIGAQIIGNIDDNGYLRATIEEICAVCGCTAEQAENTLMIIQRFEPRGVAARSLEECLLIQLSASKQEYDPVLADMISGHLPDIASRDFGKIAKALKQPAARIEFLAGIISQLDPKPGRNFSAENAVQIIPDIEIEENDGKISITINNEYIPRLFISRHYKAMLRSKNLDPSAREFITNKMRRAYELIRAVSKRQSTLRRVTEAIVNIQKEAIIEDISLLKPLTFRDIAQRIEMHESTVCRVVMNKYAQTPRGVFPLKIFFPSKLQKASETGEMVSSEFIKGLITDIVAGENAGKPLSDEAIAKNISEQHRVHVARRTVAKYREELKIPSSTYRRKK
jgi:RNA polymerase sigma-54 factor